MIRSKLLFIFFFALTLNTLAQYRDAGMWASFSANVDYKKRWEFSISPEMRLNENYSRVARLFADVGAQYKFSKQFFVTATYRGGARNAGDGFESRQRFQVGLGLRHKWNDFTITYQPRFQVSLEPHSSESDADFATTMRNKLQVKYEASKKMEYSTSFELFSNTAQYQQFVLQNWRWIAEAERRINKRNSVSLGYLIQKSLLDSPQELDYVLLLSYQVNLTTGKNKKKKQDEDLPEEIK